MVPIRFVDDRGTEWEVWELAPRRVLGDAPPSRASEGYGATSWLCFESATQRRHLATYPARWPAMLPSELMALCRAARPERPPSALRISVRAADAW